MIAWDVVKGRFIVSAFISVEAVTFLVKGKRVSDKLGDQKPQCESLSRRSHMWSVSNPIDVIGEVSEPSD